MNSPRYPKSAYDGLQMPNGDTDVLYEGLNIHLVKTRKNTKCVYCFAPIQAGDYALSEKGFVDHEPYLAHYCLDCVDDEIATWNGEIDRETAYQSWAKRYEMYAQRGNEVTGDD